MTEYRVKETRKGWIVQMRERGKWLWKTHYPFGLKECRFYRDELHARWGANVCRRVDYRQEQQA